MRVSIDRAAAARAAAGVVLLLLLCCNAGCSVVMAANQPAKKDLKKFAAGTPRGLVLAEFGQPTHTETKDGQRMDLFVFVQGYDKMNKGARVVGHAVADIFTGFLWEVAATPGEMVFDGDKMVYEVYYDPKDCVAKATLLEKKLLAGDEVKNRAR